MDIDKMFERDVLACATAELRSRVTKVSSQHHAQQLLRDWLQSNVVLPALEQLSLFRKTLKPDDPNDNLTARLLDITESRILEYPARWHFKIVGNEIDCAFEPEIGFPNLAQQLEHGSGTMMVPRVQHLNKMPTLIQEVICMCSKQ